MISYQIESNSNSGTVEPEQNAGDSISDNVVKLELDPRPLESLKIENEPNEFTLGDEEKDKSDSPDTQLQPPSVRRGAPNNNGSTEEVESSSNMPLAVPMMANTMHSSVTRNDAKIITETRLKRLRALSEKADENLSKGQKDEKKRIIRLEKNRRAAAMSRRKKKVYVKNLEENSKLMARHIAILEMENAHLRALVNASQQGQPMRPGMLPMHHLPMRPAGQFVGGNISQFMAGNASSNQCNGSMLSTTSNSLEPMTKRRKLQDGTASSTMSESLEPSPLEDTKNLLEPLEPLPLSAVPAPPSMPRMVPMMAGHMMPPGMRTMPHPSRMMGFPMHHTMPMMTPNVLPPPGTAPPPAALPDAGCPEIGKLEAIVTDKINDGAASKREPVEECKSVELDDVFGDGLNNMPPEVPLPDGEYGNLSMLDGDIMEETVDECGSVMGFQPDAKNANMVYL